jgi:hypothetical protein
MNSAVLAIDTLTREDDERELVKRRYGGRDNMMTLVHIRTT